MAFLISWLYTLTKESCSLRSKHRKVDYQNYRSIDLKNYKNMDSVVKYLEGVELVIMPSSVFKWIESFDDDIFDQFMDAISHFDNQFEEETEIVFPINGKTVEYFKLEVGHGFIALDEDNKDREMIVVDSLERIDVDEFLDYIIEGKEIIKNKELKRILINYSYL
jgi:hypothetical protein